MRTRELRVRLAWAVCAVACAARCTEPAPAPPAPPPVVTESPFPAAGTFPGLVVTESSFAGDERSTETPADLSVTLDHSGGDTEVMAVRVGEEFFALERQGADLYLVRGGWKVHLDGGSQVALRGQESAPVNVVRESESDCMRIEVSREWGAVSPLHATRESLRMLICDDRAFHEISTETRFPTGARRLFWSPQG